MEACRRSACGSRERAMQKYFLAIAFLGCWMSASIPLAAFQNEIQQVRQPQDPEPGTIASLSVRSDAEWKFFCKVAALDEKQQAFAKELDRRWVIRNLQKVAPEMLLGADAAKQAAARGPSPKSPCPCDGIHSSIFKTQFCRPLNRN